MHPVSALLNPPLPASLIESSALLDLRHILGIQQLI
jgi:hypothetical protein